MKIPKPKDLGIKLGNPTEVKWNKVKIDSEASIDQMKLNLEITENILKLANSKLEAEKTKNQSI